MADRHLGDVVHRGDLRHADPGHDPGGADRAGPDPTLTASAPASISASARRAGGDVAGDELELALDGPDARQHLDHAIGVAVGGVEDEHVGPAATSAWARS